MSTGIALLVDHGYAVLFVYVLVALLARLVRRHRSRRRFAAARITPEQLR
jgi:hypothetical protein